MMPTPLTPADVYSELGKFCYYTWKRTHWFDPEWNRPRHVLTDAQQREWKEPVTAQLSHDSVKEQGETVTRGREGRTRCYSHVS
jgi:hypothetical protein